VPRPVPVPPGALLGAHMSIAGGVHRAFERARKLGATALQVFTKSSNQWKARPLGDDEVREFRAGVRELGVRSVIAHDSYLINLASPDPALFEKSLAGFRDELLRCETLAIPNLVFHPGAHLGAGEERGIARVARALDRLHRDLRGIRVKATIELTAGQGSCLGHRFEHVRSILERTREPERLAVCVDTCHLFAAGYDIRTPAGYEATMQELDSVFTCARVEAFHLNDSKKPLGSRVDRHEHIGKGHLGLAPFRALLNDPRFRDVPKVLETEKDDELTEDFVNLRKLVGLLDQENAQPVRKRPSKAAQRSSRTNTTKSPGRVG
jgi:deoxyribonuclease IV